MYVILQVHHSESCSGYPIRCKLCELDVPRQCVSVDVLGLHVVAARVSMNLILTLLHFIRAIDGGA